MKIRNLKIILVAPFLLLTPMMCMHLGDGQHFGEHHSSNQQPFYRSSIHESTASGMMGHGWMTIGEDSPDEK
jgi:hypothetical protein